MPLSMPTHAARASIVALIVAALASVAAIPANAATILPAGTAFSGFASNWTFTYGGDDITCSKSTLLGSTAKPASNSLVVAMDAYHTCAGFGNTAMVICNPNNMTLHATAIGSGDGDFTVSLPSNFRCSITIKVFGSSICSLTYAGPQTSAAGSVFDAATTNLSLSVIGGATKDAGGSSLCGAADDLVVLSATYTVTPTNLTVTNP
jgi:hypothetical protein